MGRVLGWGKPLLSLVGLAVLLGIVATTPAAAKKSGKLAVIPGITTTMLVPPAPQGPEFQVTISGTVIPYLKDRKAAPSKAAKHCVERWVTALAVQQRNVGGGETTTIHGTEETIVTPDVSGAFSATLTVRPFGTFDFLQKEFEIRGITAVRVKPAKAIKHKGQKVVCVPGNRADEYGVPPVLDSWHYVNTSTGS